MVGSNDRVGIFLQALSPWTIVVEQALLLCRFGLCLLRPRHRTLRGSVVERLGAGYFFICHSKTHNSAFAFSSSNLATLPSSLGSILELLGALLRQELRGSSMHLEKVRESQRKLEKVREGLRKSEKVRELKSVRPQGRIVPRPRPRQKERQADRRTEKTDRETARQAGAIWHVVLPHIQSSSEL